MWEICCVFIKIFVIFSFKIVYSLVFFYNIDLIIYTNCKKLFIERLKKFTSYNTNDQW